MKTATLLLAASFFLIACTPDPAHRLEPQHWEDILVEIETRPSPPEAGMVEFIVIGTRDRGRPVNDMVVSLRSRDDHKWKQAIQDGYTGVYRTAVLVRDPAIDLLQVELVRNKENKKVVLKFPLHKSANPTP